MEPHWNLEQAELRIACRKPRTRNILPPLLLTSILLLLAGAALDPRHHGAFWVSAAPLLLAVAVLVASARRFPLTPLSYTLTALYASLRIVGAHYGHVDVPLFAGARALLGWSQSPFGPLLSAFEGIALAILAREILLRRSPLLPGRWLAFLTASATLAIGCCAEIVEWWLVTLAGGSVANVALDAGAWSVQANLTALLSGAVLALAAFSDRHDRQLMSIWEDLTAAVGWRHG